MSEARLERTREHYRCGRSMVIVPWQHCDCKGCKFSRLMHQRMRAGLAPDGKPYDLTTVDEWFRDTEAPAQ